MQGPNVKKLIVHKMSLQMVPPGAGLAGAIGSLTKPGNIQEQCLLATKWVEEALAIARKAPGSEKFPDDEAIASEILRQVEARLEAQRKERKLP